MANIGAFITFLLLWLFMAAASQASENRLVITGSSTVAPAILEIAKRYEKINPDIRIDVQTGGSSRGINDVRNGLAHIGMVSRALKAPEHDLKSHTIAMDGIGIILHKNNPVLKLTDEQIISIYKGSARNWGEFGGSELPITVVNKAEGRSTLELFMQYFAIQSREIKADIVIGDNQQGIKTVAGNPGAIGYVSIGTAEFEEQHGTPIKLIAISDVAATRDNVRDGKFPLSRPLNLVTADNPPSFVMNFIHYAQSNDVHDLIEAQFFVPLQHE